MRGEPVHNLICARAFRARRQVRTVDHQNRNIQRAGGVDFGNRALPASVFTDQKLNPLILKQLQIIRQCKGAACHGDRVIRHQGRQIGLIHKAQHIVVLGLGRKGIHMQPPKRQHDALRGAAQGGNGAVDIRHGLPAIQRISLPRGAREGHKRRAGLGAGAMGVPAHLRGEGMGCVNHMGDGVLTNVIGQAFGATKAALSGGQGLGFGAAHAACVAEGGLQPLIGYGLREGAGLGCAAKNKEMLRHV